MKILQTLIILITISQIMNGQDQGITSAIHGKYVNQIIFAKSKEALAFRNENERKFENSFTSSGHIYGRVYVDKSVQNATKDYHAGVLVYDMFIDGKRVAFKKNFGMFAHVDNPGYYTEQLDQDETFTNWTSWKVWLLPETDDDELKYGNVNVPARAFVLSLLEQPAGKHDVRLNLYYHSKEKGKDSDVLASGSFTIDIKEADKKRLAYTFTPPLPKDEYQGADKAKTIEQIKDAFIRQLRKTPITCGIYKNGWQEGSYSLTGQKYRKIAGWAVFESTIGADQVPITTFNFISDYTNGGWTKLRFDSHCLGCANWKVELAAVKAGLNH